MDRVLIIGPLEPGSPFNRLVSPLPGGSPPAAELQYPEAGVARGCGRRKRKLKIR